MQKEFELTPPYRFQRHKALTEMLLQPPSQMMTHLELISQNIGLFDQRMKRLESKVEAKRLVDMRKEMSRLNPFGQLQGRQEKSKTAQEEVNARIVCSPKAELFKLGDSGITLRYAYLSQRGYYPEDLYKANQDAFKVVPKFGGDPSQIFFGVFDGHGVDGDSCSYFVRDSIEKTLKKTMAAHPDDFERAYKECFVTINKAMHKMDFDDTMSGTTAITAFFKGTQFTVANIGKVAGAEVAQLYLSFPARSVSLSRCHCGRTDLSLRVRAG